MGAVFVTGCNRGLGHEICDALARETKVIRHIRDHRIRQEHTCVRGDLNDTSTIDSIALSMHTHEVDVLINNAGMHVKAPLTDTSDERIMNMINTNLIAQIRVTKAAYTYFKEKNHGTIININSLALKHPGAGESIYCASKYGLDGFSKSLQVESIGTGIKIIDFYIGAMKTDMCTARDNYDDLIEPREVAEFIRNIVLSKHTSYYPSEIVIRRT